MNSEHHLRRFICRARNSETTSLTIIEAYKLSGSKRQTLMFSVAAMFQTIRNASVTDIYTHTHIHHAVVSSSTLTLARARPFYSAYVQAGELIGPPARFKLSVIFLSEKKNGLPSTS